MAWRAGRACWIHAGPKPGAQALTADVTLAIDNLRKRLGSFTLDVKRLRVPSRSVVRLAGPNGSGKTTLLKLISGLLKPDSGVILMDGRDVTKLGPEERRTPLITGPNSVLPHMRVIDNLRFAQRVGEEELREIIEIVGVRRVLREKAGLLSDGLRVRVALGSTLASRPRLILVDEALDYLDPGYSVDNLGLLFDYARSRGTSIIFVSHHMRLNHDAVVTLRNGRLVNASP